MKENFYIFVSNDWWRIFGVFVWLDELKLFALAALNKYTYLLSATIAKYNILCRIFHTFDVVTQIIIYYLFVVFSYSSSNFHYAITTYIHTNTNIFISLCPVKHLLNINIIDRQDTRKSSHNAISTEPNTPSKYCY